MSWRKNLAVGTVAAASFVGGCEKEPPAFKNQYSYGIYDNIHSDIADSDNEEKAKRIVGAVLMGISYSLEAPEIERQWAKELPEAMEKSPTEAARTGEVRKYVMEKSRAQGKSALEAASAVYKEQRSSTQKLVDKYINEREMQLKEMLAGKPAERETYYKGNANLEFTTDFAGYIYVADCVKGGVARDDSGNDNNIAFRAAQYNAKSPEEKQELIEQMLRGLADFKAQISERQR